MKLPFRSGLALLTVAFGAALVPAQQSVTIEPIKDNTIFGFDPTLSNGAGSRIFCGTDQATGARRALLAFDVGGAVPSGSTIVSARLEMTIAQTRSLDLNVSIHRLTADWGEGGSLAGGGQGGGAPAQNGDATWNEAFFPATPWATRGGDFVAAASATTLCGTTGTFSWSSAQTTADVQGWLTTPSTAFGWIVVTDETTAQTARAFHSREASVSVRPKLVITYGPPASTQSFGTGCTGGGTQPLTVTANSNPVVPNPTFALQLTGGPGSGLMAIDLFAGGLLQNPLPLGGGCSLWGNFAGFLFGATTTGTLPVAIPNDPGLIGAQMGVQGLAFDPATSAFATSNGLLLSFGL